MFRTWHQMRGHTQILVPKKSSFSSEENFFDTGKKKLPLCFCQVNRHLKCTWRLRFARVTCSSRLQAEKYAISTAKAPQLQRCSAGSLSCAATVGWAHVIVTSCFVAWVSDLGNTWLAAAAWFRRTEKLSQAQLQSPGSLRQLPSHRGGSHWRWMRNMCFYRSAGFGQSPD